MEKEYNEKTKAHGAEEEEQEIDLLELGMKLWDSRRRILIWAGWGALLGLIIAFSIPREYTASVKLVPESGDSGKSMGSFGSLAALAGINMSMGTGSDAVYPDLYPEVVSSTPFTTELFNVVLPTDIEDLPQATLSEIIVDHTSTPWWSAIIGLPGKAISGAKSLFSSNDEEGDEEEIIDPFRLSPAQAGIAGAINQRIEADVDNKTSVITISATLQDPLAAASLADTVAQRLQEYVVAYRTGKARNDLEYAKKINKEARETYYKAQQQYAAFADRNQGLVSKSAAIETERLQNEATLAFDLFNSTSQQVQLAEAKVQSNTPVFTVVQPASVPLTPTKPRKMLILIGFIFLAVVVACAYTLFAPGLIKAVTEKKKNLSENNISEQS
ncbi:MAG: chain-length determining protein [Muribaculaceae bacterium]|nr:chain-length determining protein [Muribaculaceae bacterium]